MNTGSRDRALIHLGDPIWCWADDLLEMLYGPRWQITRRWRQPTWWALQLIPCHPRAIDDLMRLDAAPELVSHPHYCLRQWPDCWELYYGRYRLGEGGGGDQVKKAAEGLLQGCT